MSTSYPPLELSNKISTTFSNTIQMTMYCSMMGFIVYSICGIYAAVIHFKINKLRSFFIAPLFTLYGIVNTAVFSFIFAFFVCAVASFTDMTQFFSLVITFIIFGVVVFLDARVQFFRLL